MGGFSAVCWTDFFQGLLILGGLLTAPIFAAALVDFSTLGAATANVANFWNPFTDWKVIVSGLAWGLGYFGMPHIIIRFMSMRSQKDMKKSAAIGITWTLLVLCCSVAVGILGLLYLGFNEETNKGSLIFINTVRGIFPSIIAGILLSAVLAASMSTADSQLLSASSSFASDLYKPVFRKNKASEKEMQWAGRIVVLVIAVIALTIALNPESGSIMELVEKAWGLFGASMGPVILLSLFWRRFNFVGAIAGISVGAIVDLLWSFLWAKPTGLYELIPGFFAGLLATVVLTLITKKPSEAVEKQFDEAVKYSD